MNTLTAPQVLATKLAAACLTSLALVACAQAPQASSRSPMVVDTAASSVRFVSTKAGAAGVGGVVEVHRFERFQGGLDADGTVRLDIDLASVNTGVGIRDDRLRTMLFNVAAFPKATFTAKLDAAALAALPASGSVDLDVAGSLALAGQAQPTSAQLRVTRVSPQSLQVTSRAPLVVDLQKFGLKPGVEALRDVMGLAFIATSAPVNLDMVLRDAK
ncbi:MAG: YceI family protein [Betaproteobacteria bacterium]|jgi:polyisoprenoid-binding protein YceI|nr:YceI family protein [Rubrivivax sp.]